MRWWILLLPFFIVSCQTAKDRAGVSEVVPITRSESKVSFIDRSDEVIERKRGNLSYGMFESYKLKSGQFHAYMLYDKYYPFHSEGTVRDTLVKSFAKLKQKGFEFGDITKKMVKSDPVFYLPAENQATQCILFNKYTNHPGSAKGFIQTDEHKDAAIFGLRCFNGRERDRTNLIKAADELLVRIIFDDGAINRG